VQTSPGKIHGTDTYDLPTLGWVSALGHLRGEILQEGAANTGAFLRYVQATDRLPMLDDVVEYSEKDQKAHQPTWLFACRRPISSPATSRFFACCGACWLKMPREA
jgi:hypothetical protein